MHSDCDIAIIGAGAAGLASAIFAAEANPRLRILLLDSARSVGAKILVSGGGRCNVTHERVGPADFNGPRNVIRNILAAFDEQATVRWFESLGVRLKREETGKLFPVSDQARSVLSALLRRCEQLGPTLLTDHRVSEVTVDPSGGFRIVHARGELCAGRVILATGGRSLPKTGSDGHGWNIARRLGHTVTETHPALVPLVLDSGFFHAGLSGLSHEAELATFADGRCIDRRSGSLLWTHFGISGPVAMDASRHWVIAHAASAESVQLRCGFFPGESFEQAERRLIDQSRSQPRLTLLRLLNDRFPERLALALLHHGRIAPDTPLAHLSREDRRRLVHILTGLPLPVLRDRGWNYAEVTAGGVPLAEIDHRTMESRRTPGLHLVGEILDCDGRIGGFNFQWAWSTAHAAGVAVGTIHSRPRAEGP